jgi:hypothetical protein
VKAGKLTVGFRARKICHVLRIYFLRDSHFGNLVEPHPLCLGERLRQAHTRLRNDGRDHCAIQSLRSALDHDAFTTALPVPHSRTCFFITKTADETLRRTSVPTFLVERGRKLILVCVTTRPLGTRNHRRKTGSKLLLEFVNICRAKHRE